MKLFKKKKPIESEKKSAVGYQSTKEFEVFGFSSANKLKWHEISNLIAWKYYMQVSVVYNAIDIISQLYSVIPPRIWDNKEERFLTDEDNKLEVYGLLNLLKKPSFGTSYNEFAKQMVPNYLATGDLFIIAEALNDKRPPRRLEIINSQNVVVDNEDKKGCATKYTVEYPDYTVSFEKDIKTGRFYNETRKQELWHTKIFNPTDKNKGFSPLNPLYYEIEQFIAAAIHNGNLLKQGARPSGILYIDPEADLKEENRALLKAEIKNFYKGAENAGNVLIMENGKDFKQLSISNKDMDFSTLKKTTVEQIYRNLKIPLAFVLAETMTLDNFKQATIVLYDMAVLPISEILFQELDLFLMARYDQTDRYELKYNEKDIAALKTKFISNANELIKTGVLVLNEGRALLDLSPLDGDAGQQIYQPANLLPIGVVREAKQMEKEKYTDLLRKNSFTEKQITEYIEKYYKND